MKVWRKLSLETFTAFNLSVLYANYPLHVRKSIKMSCDLPLRNLILFIFNPKLWPIPRFKRTQTHTSLHRAFWICLAFYIDKEQVRSEDKQINIFRERYNAIMSMHADVKSVNITFSTFKMEWNVLVRFFLWHNVTTTTISSSIWLYEIRYHGNALKKGVLYSNNVIVSIW